MNRDDIHDGVEEAVGKARKAASGAFKQARSRLDGPAHRAAENAEDAYGAALKSLEGAARDRPLQVVALALGLGFIAGLLAVRRY
ncbi:MAG TPA: hypothetical protein VHY32_05855 [Caulobacteraceae bacterium]|jgi:ElaB/YqjD/DUF883 family membrane-anchored ribosome-binding protein|nr:hypothetical protein [Caulobacteraceae bacterium]